MESCAQKLLETAALRTLHAHSFSRSSNLASNVLTDLLSRYLALLSSTSAKHAQHAGRTSLTVYDVVSALDDLGMSMHELSDFAAIEAKELSRYAVYSTRRIEDLYDLRGNIASLPPVSVASS
jgi:histone H3/H4